MSLFSSQANTQFNSFSDPFNSMNMNRGPWGMDPNYLTPAYDAPYRPPYSGAASFRPNTNPGFFQSAWGVGPFGAMPYGVGNQQQDEYYYSQLHDRPADSVMAGAQKFATPIMGFGLGMAMENAWRNTNPNVGRGIRSIKNWWTYGSGNNISGFTAMGSSAGEATARGIIRGASMFRPSIATSGFARAGITGMGVAGGLAGSIFLPAAVAQGVTAAADDLVFNNYTGIRENQNMLRSAFRGVSFAGDGVGNTFTGQGLSREASARMGTRLTQIGAKDQVFNAREVATLTDMSAQMGLLDNASAGQITKRMESIVKQVKLVMSIAGTTDFKEAINIMAKFQAGGVSGTNLSAMSGAMGGLASAAGISFNRMVNTVGAQGQYIYQTNGLTPYLGQLAAGQSMAGLAGAFRTGLVSPELMARLGGVEGATQHSVTGQVNAAQTLYNQMRAFNRASGMGGQGVIQNVSNFGNAMSRDPLSGYGAMIFHNSQNLSNMLKGEGAMNLHNQVVDLARMVSPQSFRNGKLGFETAAALMQSQMGMTPEQIQAYFAQYASTQDPRARSQQLAGFRSAQINMTRDYLEQTGQTRFASMMSPVSKTWRNVRSNYAGMIGEVLGATGMGTDAFSNWWQSATTGSPEQLGGVTMEDLKGSAGTRLLDVDAYKRDNRYYSPFQLARNVMNYVGDDWTRAGFGMGLGGSWAGALTYDHAGDMEKINQLAKAGNKHAADAISGDILKAKNGLFQLAQNGQISERYKNKEHLNSLAEAVSWNQRVEGSDVRDSVLGEMHKDLAGPKGMFKEGLGVLDQRATFEAASTLMDKFAGGKELDMRDKATRQAFQTLRGNLSGGLDADSASIKETVDKLVRYRAEKRLDVSDTVSSLGGVSGAMQIADDPAQRHKIFKNGSKNLDKYLQATDPTEKQKLIEQELLDNGQLNPRAAGAKFINSQVDPETMHNFMKSQAALNKQQQQINKMASEGKIDMTSYYGMTSGIEMNKAVSEFGMYVKEFGANVKKGDSTSSPGATAWNFVSGMIKPDKPS